jgi:multidrug efflux pump subunit AcrA (membrane-fusion protein)
VLDAHARARAGAPIFPVPAPRILDQRHFAVGERDGDLERAGARASVRVEHGGGVYRWPARIDRIEAAVDSATRTFNVIVRVDDPAARGVTVSGDAAAAPPLLVGMYAAVDIEGIDPGPQARVPRRALRDGNVLWLLDAAGKVSVRPVRVLQEANNQVVVSAQGLPARARVVVSDLKVVTDGMRVREIGAAAGRPPS